MRFWNLIVLTIQLTVGSAIADEQQSRAHQEVMDQIFSDWRSRRTAMDAVEYRLEGSELFPMGIKSQSVGFLIPSEYEGAIPPEDVTFPLESRYVFDFARNRIRWERHYQAFFTDTVQFYPAFEIHLFDGERAQQLDPREENTSDAYTPPEYQPELHNLESRHLDFLLDFEQEAFYLAHGRPPVFDSPEPGFHRFTSPIHRDVFRWHGESSIEGRKCTVLRTTNARDSGEIFFDYWVDLERESAVVRCVRNANGNLEQLDVDFQQTPHGWLPARFVRSSSSRDGTLTRHYEFIVRDIIANPQLADALFHVEPEPGMVVKDHATNERFVYRGSDEGNIDVRQHHMERLRASQQTGSTWWKAMAAVVAVVLIAIVWVASRWRAV